MFVSGGPSFKHAIFYADRVHKQPNGSRLEISPAEAGPGGQERQLQVHTKAIAQPPVSDGALSGRHALAKG